MLCDISDICVLPSSSIHHAITCIDRNNRGIALIADEEGHLLGTITDGDIRRAILAGQDLNSPVSQLLAQKRSSPYSDPVTALVGTERSDLLKLLQEHFVRQIPLLDEHGKVVDLVTLDELLPNQILPLKAVIMAGGFGTRLRPLTDELPKPMLPVGDRPLMELTIEQLRQAGVQRVNVTTHYLPEKITNYFGNGEDFGINLQYVAEDRPLGTAGALGLMEVSDETLLVINGDILTKVDFRAMLDYHREHKAEITIAVRQYDVQVPYGVIECNGPRVNQLNEKPSFKFLVNAGIYLLEPSVYRYIPDQQHFDMTDLIECVLNEEHTVVSFPIREYWLDIGQQVDYEQAQEDAKDGRFQTE